MTGFLTCAVRPHLPGMAASGNIAADIKAFTAAGTVPDLHRISYTFRPANLRQIHEISKLHL